LHLTNANAYNESYNIRITKQLVLGFTFEHLMERRTHEQGEKVRVKVTSSLNALAAKTS